MNLTKPQKLIYDMEKFAGGSISVICGSMLVEGSKDLSGLRAAVNELYRLNDALRIRFTETDDGVEQYVADFAEQEIEVLNFDDKSGLDAYAESYAKAPINMFSSLCDVKIVLLPDNYGILIKMHHLIGDAWTLSLLGSQFNAILNGETSEAYSYTDYIESESNYLDSKRYTKDRDFFLEQFKKCDEVTYISEKQNKTFESKRKTFVIDADKAKVINNYITSHQTSAFMLFMAALATYINRTKMNAEKFYIGTAVLNRGNNKEKNTVGMFINTVPMLIELDNNADFKSNLSEVENTVFSVFRHQKYNYGDVLNAIRKEYNFTEKLYDVMLSYQNAAITGGNDTESTWYHCGMQSESLQIHIDDRDNEGIYKIQYDYQIEKFTEFEIGMLHAHIMNLMFDGIDDDSKKLYELNILTKEEQQKLLFNFNDTAVDYPRDKCVHQLFEEQVGRTPDKYAVIACDKTLTYRELNEEANRIAHSLIERGVGVGDIVAFALPRKSYLIAAMLGILKSGAAYLPIDPDYPQDRIEFMLSDSNAKLFITEDNVDELLSNEIVSNPEIVISSDDLCYCIYTSGSTGKPKATLLTHGNVANYVNNNNNNVVHKIIKNSYKRIVSITTIGFDIFVTESLLPLANGLEILLANEEQSKFQTHLSKLLEKYPADVLQTTPTKMKSLIADETNLAYLKGIKVIVLGGETLDGILIEKLKAATDSKIFNIYGPTETTVFSNNAQISNNTDITIGKPIANTQIYIVDKYMQPTPIGVTGELCISGAGVGAGYLNRPELTAEKFIDNPFGEGKLYKTGDLAYWRDDGNIIYVGRNDFQVKIRGLRIELGEIENAMMSLEEIRQAVVVVRKNNEGRQLICAFYTGDEVDAREIRSHIGKKLPKYMLPHIFTHLEEMPLTSSGKINRKSLPEVDLYAADTAVEYVAPRTEKEIALVNAIQNVLGINKVGMLDNFFDLGGDSLKAIELISKLQKAGCNTNTKTIFDCETVKELADKLTAAKTEEETFEFEGDMPATAAQMRIYTAQSMNADSTAYNVPYAFKTESIDADKLQKAINGLVVRHESLRTHFENKDGQIVQVIDDSAICEIESLQTDDISAFIRPFDLSRSPLMRVGYCNNTVIIDMHHIITDGGSMPTVLSELNELYMGRTLSDAPVQYKQFAVKEQYSADDEEYWLSVYSDEIPVLEINTDFKRGQKQSVHGNVCYDYVDIELHNKILALCKKHNITPFVFYMSGFNILLSKFSGNEDIVVGMPISGRKSQFLNTVGMFVNTIALRNKPNGAKTVTEFLNEVKENSISAIVHQDYPYGELVKKLGIHTDGRNPLFDVMFAYQSEEMTDVLFADKKAELLPIPVTTSKYDFTFNILPRDNDVVIMAEYCTDLYKENTMQRFIDGYKQILEQMLGGKQMLSNLFAILPEERQKLLFDFNDTAADYPRDKCVHQLFEEQAGRTPDKAAVIACDKTLTYRELNEEANKIAHSLIERGVGVGDIVAFALPRKSYLIAAMLGILKSGAAYLPIDPDYPQDRIEFMLSDSNAKLFVTEDNIAYLLENNNLSNPNIVMNSDSLCYCIYTSGTTGNPKAVMVVHNNVANFVSCNSKNNFQKCLVKHTEIILSVNSVTFDIVLQEIHLPLVNGLSINLICDNDIINGEFKIKNNTLYGLICTPTKIKMYMQNLSFCNSLKQVSVIMCGAESFPNELKHEIHQHTNAIIFNGYGPTEITCGAAYADVSNSDITIGKPIANTQIYIVDKYMQPTPIGVTGELCVSGAGVGAGYLNRPELTAEKFIDNPFGEGKLYKTGDLAYWRDDGNIVYVGRNDFQVKIRGLRIELGEIENVMMSLEEIRQAVVVVRKNNEGRQLICAFYTGDEVDAKGIRSHIGKKLPKYMLPHIFTHLEEMPLTSSGKINRKSLPEVDLENISSNTEYIKPQTELQKEIARLMEQVLKYSPIGLDDNFFDCGGDSLMAIELVSKAHNEGIYFNLQAIFDNPTVKELCEFIENGDKEILKYDETEFADINAILLKNTIKNISERNISAPKAVPVGNVLIAGATGYLGIHILSDFLDNDNGIAYCLVRGEGNGQSKNRLKELLQFYFDNKYSELIDTRIKVLCSDLTKDNLGLTNEDYADLMQNVCTVINCAASVKHYGSYKYFYETNVETVKNLIDFCFKSNAKLIHTSTLSVSGNSFGDEFDGYISETEKHFYESSLYIGQPLENVYARSKFEAEKEILSAMTNGLKANIMRMGNLTNRFSDGKFQKNYESNAFLQRVRAILNLGIFPQYLMDLYVEFTPIDEAANAVMTIARHFSDEQTVFHINSTKVVYMDKLIELFGKIGIDMRIVDGKTFTDALRQTAKQTNTEFIFETFINDMDNDDKLNYDSNIRIENDFTVKYLQNLGFGWPDIGIEYIEKYINYLRKTFKTM